MRSYPVKENLIASAVSEILLYKHTYNQTDKQTDKHTDKHKDKHTDKHLDILLLYYKDITYNYKIDFFLYHANRYIITWMLHQIFMNSNRVKLAVDYNNDTPNPPILANPWSSF